MLVGYSGDSLAVSANSEYLETYYPAVLTLGSLPTEGVYTRMFKAVLFPVVQSGNNSSGYQLLSIQAMECYTAMKRCPFKHNTDDSHKHQCKKKLSAKRSL